MTTSRIYKIIIALLFILLFLACGGEKKTEHPVRICQDSSRNVVTVDRVNGYRLRSDIDLPIVLNLHLFKNAKDFENYFVQRVDTVYDALNFEVFSVAAIILDNKIGVLEHGEATTRHVSLSVVLDSAFYTSNCTLYIPFSLKNSESEEKPVSFLEAVAQKRSLSVRKLEAERRELSRFALFKIPKNSTIHALELDGIQNATMSARFDL